MSDGYGYEPHHAGEPTNAPRLRAISQLLERQEIADTAYVLGEIDRPKWQAELKEVDEKLAVLGLRLATHAHTPPF